VRRDQVIEALPDAPAMRVWFPVKLIGGEVIELHLSRSGNLGQLGGNVLKAFFHMSPG
jgi:hypothetical protein